ELAIGGKAGVVQVVDVVAANSCSGPGRRCGAGRGPRRSGRRRAVRGGCSRRRSPTSRRRVGHGRGRGGGRRDAVGSGRGSRGHGDSPSGGGTTLGRRRCPRNSPGTGRGG